MGKMQNSRGFAGATMRVAACLGLVLLVLRSVSAQQASWDYRNPRLPIEQRVADLLQRMTLEEKVGQLTLQFSREIIDTTGKYNNESARETLREMFSPDFQVSVRDAAVVRNAAQRFALEKTRLGIPEIFMGEALHGFMSNGATSFPQALGLASTWDPGLVRQVFTAAADEMASAGVKQAFTPVLDLARDPRWGRTEETYGEDPYLASRMAVAAVEGMQGENYLIDRHHVLATAKHFAVHGNPRAGPTRRPATIPSGSFANRSWCLFARPSRRRNAGSVMASYNEIDGIPSHVNPWLLDKVLRQEWGFRGYVVSDGGGLQMLVETHHIAADFAGAARQALAAGVDLRPQRRIGLPHAPRAGEAGQSAGVGDRPRGFEGSGHEVPPGAL